MSRRRFIAALVLVAIIAGAGVPAFRIWRQQERAAFARAALPVIPNLIRWPGEMVADVQDTTAAVRSAKHPVKPLGRLAALYFANGFAPEARQTLEALRQLDPENARWAYLLAELRLRSGDRQGAGQELETVVTLDPDYAPAWIRLGDLWLERQVPDRAEECYLQAVTVEPGDVRARFALIAFEARHGRRTDPRQTLIELIHEHPGIEELHELLAQLHAAAGDPVAAARERRLAAKADRHLGNEDPWLDELAELCSDPNRLGLFAHRYAREKRLTMAEKLLKRAIRLGPADATPRKALAAVFQRSERMADARTVLETALVECPNDPTLPAALARLLRLEHRPVEAAAAIRTALERWPGRGELLAALGFALRDARENEDAVAALREAIRLDPSLVEAHYSLGFCLLALRRSDEARAEAEQALAMRPNYTEALVLLGSLALDKGELELAQRHIFKLYELQPDEPGSRLLYSAFHLTRGNDAQRTGRLDEAERWYRTGLGVSPEFAPLLREAALLAARRAQYAQVTEFFERYLRLEPRDLDVFAPLADAYREIRRPELAERALERGVKMAEKLGNAAKAAEFTKLLEQ